MKTVRDSIVKGFSGSGFLFGFGFFLAVWKWNDIALHEFFQASLPELLFRILFSVGLLSAALIARLVFSRKDTLLASKGFTYSATGSLFAVSLITSLAHGSIWPLSQEITSLIGLLNGFAIGGGVLLWAERFGFVSVIKAIAGLTLAYLVCLVTFFYLLNMTVLFTGITVVALPLISFCLLISCKTRAQESGERKTPFSPMRASASGEILLWVILVTAILSLAMGYGDETATSLEVFQIGSLLPVLFIIGFLFVFPGKMGFEGMYRVSLILITIGLLVFLFDKRGSAFGQILIGSGYFVVSITMIIVAASYANLSRTSAAKSYVLVIMANSIGSFLGAVTPAIFSLLDIPLYSDTTVLALVIMLLLLFAFSTFRKESSFYSHFDTVSSALELDARGTSDAALCETIGKEHRMTKRETSILFMHLKGLSQAEIANEMFIAEGTVRAHYGNIYRKLSVHSRDELNEALAACRKRLDESGPK